MARRRRSGGLGGGAVSPRTARMASALHADGGVIPLSGIPFIKPPFIKPAAVDPPVAPPVVKPRRPSGSVKITPAANPQPIPLKAAPTAAQAVGATGSIVVPVGLMQPVATAVPPQHH